MRGFKSRVQPGGALFALMFATTIGAQTLDAGTIEQVTVTARKRDESLLDVPISITAVTEAAMDRNGLRSIADIAPNVPGLNVNSDSVGRAFVSIRGIGTALQAGVQPGVGVFQDGVYAPQTSYINNPTLDIQRIEVLRGPQGTLYGKNTLGGAINIITRPPSETFEGKFYGSYTDQDNGQEFGGRIGGPLGDSVRAKIAVASRDADGFYTNKLIGGKVDESSSNQVDGTIVWDVSDDARLTVNAYFLDFDGPSTNYNHVNGTTDYRDNVRMNVIGRQDFQYTGANAKFEFPLDSIKTKVTAIGAYDERELGSVSDGDFLSLDIVRSSGNGTDKTYTGELRFDTTFSDTFSTLIGLYASREESDALTQQTLVPAARTANSFAERSGNTYSIFATGLWRFAEQWELSVGARIDEEDREQDSRTTISTLPGVVLTDPHREIDSSEFEPRVSLTRFLTKDAMLYGSVAKGYRGGGFNAASVPAQFSTYDGDTVWTYEIGGKASSADGRWLVSSAVYYNDYTDFIGQNALAIGPGGGLVSIDLNLGDVESYGLETEVAASLTDMWKLSGSVTLMHARITDQSGWLAVTGTPLATDRLLFQPDWNASISSDLTVPVGMGDVTWNLGVVGKGSRPGSSFDPTTPSILDSYTIVNTSVTYRRNGFSASVFANNLLDEEYFESYIDGSLLQALGLLNQDLGMLGTPQKVGLRLQYEF
jgi:iron complex outermembrane receptor protein